jgi:hypothetical protein
VGEMALYRAGGIAVTYGTKIFCIALFFLSADFPFVFLTFLLFPFRWPAGV